NTIALNNNAPTVGNNAAYNRNRRTTKAGCHSDSGLAIGRGIAAAIVPTENTNAPPTGCESAEVTRHDSRYWPAGSAVKGWVMTLPLTPTVPSAATSRPLPSTKRTEIGLTGSLNCSTTAAGAAASAAPSCGSVDNSSACAQAPVVAQQSAAAAT